MTNHDDLPHPVPPLAYLRYKENYFFVIMCPEHGIFGGLHFNNEPGFDRTKMHLDLLVNGKNITYHNVVPISPNFGKDPFVSDGVVTMTVHESHKLFSVVMNTEELALDLKFEARFPTFDFHACKYAAPDLVSFKDVVAFGLNIPIEHIEQSMTVSGTVRAGADAPIHFGGLAYRDHSWGARGDNLTAWHSWSVINFPDRAFGIMSQRSQPRSGLMAREGYVVDAAGPRVIKMLTATATDFSAGGVLPAKMVYELTDVFDETYVLEADVAGCLGRVGLSPEVAIGNQVPYTVTDNFCMITDMKSGENGIGLIELGYHSKWSTPFV